MVKIGLSLLNYYLLIRSIAVKLLFIDRSIAVKLLFIDRSIAVKLLFIDTVYRC